MKNTLAEIAQESIDIQDACNISGLARAFVKAIDTIRESGIDSNYDLATHPIVTLYASLNLTDCLCSDCMDNFGKAYSAVQALAKSEVKL
jgi:hypothetical protein